MPPKPRPHGKKPPPRPRPGMAGGGISRRTILMFAVGGALAIAAIAAVSVVALGGGKTDARTALEDAGCTLTAKPALKGDHSVTTPDGTSDKWTTDPPTSGPHYQLTVVWGIYTEPVNQAQLVHNLEHGGIEIQYGKDVPSTTIDKLKAFAQSHPRGTVLAPYPKLGKKIALGAWTLAPDPDAKGTAYLAECTAFNEKALDAFFDAYQFQGPERFPADSLLPGRN